MMKIIENPPNPFLSHDCRYLDGMAPPAKLIIYEDATRQILSRNESPDLGFRWSLNPYRGCTHACAYCYARPSHEYLGFGAGTDFETKITVKPRAPELLRESFIKYSWKGEKVVFSGDTDPYQPLEASYQLTKRCLKVCLEFGNPVTIITKSFLIVRDLELLSKLHKRTYLWVVISIPFLDEKTARLVEPGAASIEKRFEAVERLSAEGILVSVNLAPLIPGVNDSDIPGILKKARQCGARSADLVLLRLPGSVKDVFLPRMEKKFPLAYEKMLGRIREVRGGKLYNSEFGSRHHGSGDYWENLQKLFTLWVEKLGLDFDLEPESRPPFHRPNTQKELFFESV